MRYERPSSGRHAQPGRYARCPCIPGAGSMPGVDLTSNAALRDVAEEGTAVDELR